MLTYFVLQPFWTPLILAGVFAFLFQPMYQELLSVSGARPSLAALVTTIVILVLVIVPVTFLGVRIFNESNYLYETISGNNGSLVEIFHKAIDQAYRVAPVLQNLHIDFNQYLERALNVMVQNMGMVFSNVAKIILDVFVFLIAFYFLLKDGQKLKEYLVKISPLASTDNELIIGRLRAAVSSVIKGNLLIGLIQGSLIGIGLAVLGAYPMPFYGEALR